MPGIHHPSPPASHPGVWAGAAAACVLVLLMVSGFVLGTEPGQRVDSLMRLNALQTDHPLPDLNPENRWIAVFVLAPPLLIAAALTWQLRAWRAGITAAAVIAGSNITTQLIKLIWTERPELIDEPHGWTGNSLPSGHTTMAASAAVAIFLIAPPRHRPAAGVLAAAWAGGWGAYIYIEAWHRPSDMVAAFLVVAAWALAGGWVILRISPPHRTTEPEVDADHHIGPSALCWVLGILAILAAGMCFSVAGGWAGLHEAADGQPWRFAAGILISSGPAFLLAGAAITLFASATPRTAGPHPAPAAQPSHHE
ncbi:phosphatase PAP2 family protein [Nesterenkonia alba]|uniref:phosphatase PAP2 family protein n=1 Tax=Nesterenkonia alba TaxID=515814 RepID=UPI00042A6F6D|nr:phosphatase PAP2 family protein [Nesterenkonia alba]